MMEMSISKSSERKTEEGGLLRPRQSAIGLTYTDWNALDTDTRIALPRVEAFNGAGGCAPFYAP